MTTLTKIHSEFILQVVVSLFGRLVCCAELGLVLVHKGPDLLNLFHQVQVMFVHQPLNPAP